MVSLVKIPPVMLQFSPEDAFALLNLISTTTSEMVEEYYVLRADPHPNAQFQAIQIGEVLAKLERIMNVMLEAEGFYAKKYHTF